MPDSADVTDARRALMARTRSHADPNALGAPLALGGAALAVVAALWLPYWDPASLGRAYGTDVGWEAQVLESNNLMDETIGWLFIGVALACIASVGVSSLTRHWTRGPIIAGIVAMFVASWAVATASALTPVNFARTYGAATAGLGLYAELVAGFLMVIGGLAIRRRVPVRTLVALTGVGVVIATSAWWYGSMHGGKPQPGPPISSAPSALGQPEVGQDLF